MSSGLTWWKYLFASVGFCAVGIFLVKAEQRGSVTLASLVAGLFAWTAATVFLVIALVRLVKSGWSRFRGNT